MPPPEQKRGKAKEKPIWSPFPDKIRFVRAGVRKTNNEKGRIQLRST
jgi:hypothetical protein